MTAVEVGPATVRGADPVDDDLARAAIESIDDTLMLVDDRPVSVRAVMAALLRSAAGSGADGLTVVHPTWWSRRRVKAVLDAAGDICGAAVAVARSEALGDGCEAIVEIAAQHVAVISADVCTITRTSDDAVSAAVVHHIGYARAAVVDVPPGVVTVAMTGTHPVRLPSSKPAPAAPSPERPGLRAIPVLVGALLAAASVGAVAIRYDATPPVAAEEASTLLVEGRAAVVVPARWTVRRITDGRGSARVQITSPVDAAIALHVTQSPLPHAQTLE